MYLSNDNIIKLPVFTKSGDKLGQVSHFEVDTISQQIVKYYVKSGGLVNELLRKDKELIIDQSQVISISAEKMVVEDLTAKERADLLEKKEKAVQGSPAIAMVKNK